MIVLIKIIVMEFLIISTRMFHRSNYKYLICTFPVESIKFPIYARFFSQLDVKVI